MRVYVAIELLALDGQNRGKNGCEKNGYDHGV